MIEDLNGCLWMIDFNARFPAWIFASSFSGCNLPAELIEHAIYSCGEKLREMEVKEELLLIAKTSPSSVETLLATANFVKKGVPFYLLPGKRQASENARASFTRSVIEMPRANITIDRTMRLPKCALSNHMTQNKGGRSSFRMNKSNPIPLVPLTTNLISDVTSLTANISKDLAEQVIERKALNRKNELDMVLRSIDRDLRALGTATLALLKDGPISTPKRVLCLGSISESLKRHQSIFCAAAIAAAVLASVKSTNHVSPLQIQLCNSVKVLSLGNLVAPTFNVLLILDFFLI
jgi:hypothetical protein